MEGTFFQSSFAKRSIEVVTPNAEEKNYIGTKIETELEFGKALSETQRAFKEIAERIIREEQAQPTYARKAISQVFIRKYSDYR